MNDDTIPYSGPDDVQIRLRHEGGNTYSGPIGGVLSTHLVPGWSLEEVWPFPRPETADRDALAQDEAVRYARGLAEEVKHDPVVVGALARGFHDGLLATRVAPAPVADREALKEAIFEAMSVVEEEARSRGQGYARLAPLADAAVDVVLSTQGGAPTLVVDREALVDQVAAALADDWNPDRDPVLTAMFRDYAMTAINVIATRGDAATSTVTAEQVRVLGESYARDRWPDATVDQDPELIEVSVERIREWFSRAGIEVEVKGGEQA